MEDLKDIVKGTEKFDADAIEQGSHIKYVLEYYDKNEDLVDLVNFYTDRYYELNEFLKCSNDIKKEGFDVVPRGPFELYKDAFDEAKIVRYQWEKSKVKDDEEYISREVVLHKDKYKYLYVLTIELFTIERVYSTVLTNRAMRTNEIKKLLKVEFGSNPKIVRKNLNNFTEKIYT